MTVQNPPYCLQAAADKHSAELFRRATGTLLGATGGIVHSGDLAVTEHVAANMTVNVVTGEAWVPGTSSTRQGQYYVLNDATVNLAISGSDASNPRIEKVILRIKDEAFAGSENEAALEVVKGTAEAGATLANKKGAGATPASSLVLAYVLVPAKATSIVAADIENVATPFGSGHNLPVVLRGENFTAESGVTYLVTGTTTVTLATPVTTFNAQIYAATGAVITIKPSSGAIYGDFVVAAASVKLLQFQHVTFGSDGTNYIITGGEPKREAGYSAIKALTKAEAEVATVPSTTRPSTVVLSGMTATTVSVGTGGTLAVAEAVTAITLYLNPGEGWAAQSACKVATKLL